MSVSALTNVVLSLQRDFAEAEHAERAFERQRVRDHAGLYRRVYRSTHARSIARLDEPDPAVQRVGETLEDKVAQYALTSRYSGDPADNIARIRERRRPKTAVSVDAPRPWRANMAPVRPASASAAGPSSSIRLASGSVASPLVARAARPSTAGAAWSPRGRMGAMVWGEDDQDGQRWKAVEEREWREAGGAREDGWREEEEEVGVGAGRAWETPRASPPDADGPTCASAGETGFGHLLLGLQAAAGLARVCDSGVAAAAAARAVERRRAQEVEAVTEQRRRLRRVVATWSWGHCAWVDTVEEAEDEDADDDAAAGAGMSTNRTARSSRQSSQSSQRRAQTGEGRPRQEGRARALIRAQERAAARDAVRPRVAFSSRTPTWDEAAVAETARAASASSASTFSLSSPVTTNAPTASAVVAPTVAASALRRPPAGTAEEIVEREVWPLQRVVRLQRLRADMSEFCATDVRAQRVSKFLHRAASAATATAAAAGSVGGSVSPGTAQASTDGGEPDGPGGTSDTRLRTDLEARGRTAAAGKPDGSREDSASGLHGGGGGRRGAGGTQERRRAGTVDGETQIQETLRLLDALRLEADVPRAEVAAAERPQPPSSISAQRGGSGRRRGGVAAAGAGPPGGVAVGAGEQEEVSALGLRFLSNFTAARAPKRSAPFRFMLPHLAASPRGR